MLDRCLRDQLLVNGGVDPVGLPKGRVLILRKWLEDVSNDIGKEYASNRLHAGQDRPGLVVGLCGQCQVKGNRGILGLLVTRAPFILKVLLCLEGQDRVEVHLHKRLTNYANLVHGAVLVLDPEDGKLKPGHRYLGSGFGPANRTTDAVNFAVVELGEGLLALQELFLIEAGRHQGGETKHILIPKEKVCLCVCVAGYCNCEVGLRGW